MTHCAMPLLPPIGGSNGMDTTCKAEATERMDTGRTKAGRMKSGRMREDTVIVGAGRDPQGNHGIVNPPVYHASTVLFPTVAAMEEAQRNRLQGGITYGRYGTPTTFALEDAVAALEGGERGVAVCSGLAAVCGALLGFVKAGDHVLMVDTVYGPARRFCDGPLRDFGVETTYYPPGIGAGIAGLIRPETRVVYLEAPGSLTFEMQDIPAIAAAARAAGATTIMDNTWATPLLCKPIALGVDVVVHAATKYIVGHSDAMLGVIVTTAATYEPVRRAVSLFGYHAAPDDCYLGLRGFRTLSVRLARHQQTALALARWLQNRPEVARVLYPALPEDPGHGLWRRDFAGASGLFGVVLHAAPKPAVAAMLDGLSLYGMGASWGGFESLILPTNPAVFRTAEPWAAEGPSLRIHAGLEDPEDLVADLEAGFARLHAAADAA